MPTIATVQVFDFETFSGDPTQVNPANVAGALITATLNYNQINAVSPQANLQAGRVQTLTDTTGRWQLNLVPNGNINPAGTLWTIQTPTQNYQISVPASGPVQSSSIKVNAPATLAGAGGTVTGPLTVTGLLTAQAGETVAGGLTVSTGGATVQAGGLTVQAGGATIAGGETVSGGVLNAQAGLTVAGSVSLPAASVGVAALSGVLPVANGGTGSGTQNFVDLSTAQTVGGAKTFSALLTAGAHILATGSTPTLGALQSGIASQSIVGNDIRGTVTVTVGGVALGTGAPIAIVNFATAYGSTPIVVVTTNFPGSGTLFGAMQVFSVSATSFSISNGNQGQNASQTFSINYVVIG